MIIILSKWDLSESHNTVRRSEMEKRKVSGSWLIILAMVVALLATVVPLSVSAHVEASSATIYIPDNYMTIQEYYL